MAANLDHLAQLLTATLDARHHRKGKQATLPLQLDCGRREFPSVALASGLQTHTEC